MIYMLLMVTTILFEILWWQSNLSFLLPINRSGAKSKSSPTNGPSSFKYKYKYKHQSKCDVLHFTFFPYNTVYTCLACVARFDFFTNCFNAICLHKNLSEVLAAFQKEKPTSYPKENRRSTVGTTKWCRIFYPDFFHLTLKTKGSSKNNTTISKRSIHKHIHDEWHNHLWLLPRKTRSEQTAFRWHRLSR